MPTEHAGLVVNSWVQQVHLFFWTGSVFTRDFCGPGKEKKQRAVISLAVCLFPTCWSQCNVRLCEAVG